MLADHIGIPQLRDMGSRSERLGGEFDLHNMPRLTELLSTGKRAVDQHIEVQLAFHNGSQGFPEISGVVSGSLELRCQRCLGALAWPVDVKFQLVVVDADEDVEQVAEPFDTIVATEQGVSLAELVEDEVLGSLPLAPMHEAAELCADAEIVKQAIVGSIEPGELERIEAGGEAVSDIPGSEEVHQPFAGLSAMLKHDDDPDKEH
jgi:uncharacterized protein